MKEIVKKYCETVDLLLTQEKTYKELNDETNKVFNEMYLNKYIFIDCGECASVYINVKKINTHKEILYFEGPYFGYEQGKFISEDCGVFELYFEHFDNENENYKVISIVSKETFNDMANEYFNTQKNDVICY